MPTFNYQARQSPAETITGTVAASTKKEAIEEISRLGYFIISITEEKEVPASVPTAQSTTERRSLFKKISLKEITQFTRQLSDLLEAGVPAVRALEVLSNQTANKEFKKCIVHMRDLCVSGHTLSQALARYPNAFSHLYVVMVRAGETGGSLGAVLRRLALFFEKELEIRTKIRTAIAYPVLMTAVGAATIFVILTFVVPRMTAVFKDTGQAMPLPTQLLIFSSTLFTQFGWLVIVGCVGGIWALHRFYKTPTGRFWMDKKKTHIPVYGRLEINIEIARFAHMLATLLGNGVSMLEALKVSSDTLNNVFIKKDISACHEAIKTGHSLSGSLASSPIISQGVIQRIAVGEDSGTLETTLLKIAESFERETDESIKIMLSLLEPALILILGFVVGFIVLAILLPIFNMSSLTS